MNKIKKFFLYIFLFGLIFGLGFLTRDLIKPKEKSIVWELVNKEPQKREIDFSLFWDVWDLVEKNFIGKIDRQKLVYSAIKGMVTGLDDPFSSFLTPEEMKEFEEELYGNFQGIGAEITIKNGNLTIVTPLKDSPAEKAGLKPGDIILKIDDKDATLIDLLTAVKLIRGPKGTKVKLTIKRDSLIKEIEVERDLIKIKSVELEFLEDGKIAYLKILRFLSQTPSELIKAASEILERNPSYGIILDLRNNPGGFFQGSLEVASMFIPDGPIVIQEYKNGVKEVYQAKQNAKLRDFPLVCLINRGSASASEIVAGAIRDRKRGILIGEKTFGKGSVQDLEELKDGSALRLTVAKWLTPNGFQINGQGLLPDIEVKMEEDSEKDLQLEKAIEELKILALK